MKVFNCLYVHCYTASHAPKAWLNYIKFCTTHFKKPNTKMLSKLIVVAKISKTMQKPEQKPTVNNTTLKRLREIRL